MASSEWARELRSDGGDIQENSFWHRGTWQKALALPVQCPSLSTAAWWSLNTEGLRGEKASASPVLAVPGWGEETACGENTAPMALKQESVLQKQSLWKWDGLELGPDPTW